MGSKIRISISIQSERMTEPEGSSTTISPLDRGGSNSEFPIDSDSDNGSTTPPLSYKNAAHYDGFMHYNDFLGRFNIEPTELGKGGNGVVNLATDILAGCKCAVKELKHTIFALTEAKFGLQFDHENLCKTIAYTYDNGRLYIAMELLSGSDLFKFSKMNPSFFKRNPQSFLDVFFQISQGLEYMHSKGVIHHDVKLENIIFDGKKVKIMDFGFSIEVPEHPTCYEPMGTLFYFAPEIVKIKPQSSAVDIWALGVLMYELFEGNPPIYQGTKYHISQKISRLMSPPSIPEKLADTIKASPELELIWTTLSKCLEVDPAKRPTALQLCEILREGATTFTQSLAPALVPALETPSVSVSDFDADTKSVFSVLSSVLSSLPLSFDY